MGKGDTESPSTEFLSVRDWIQVYSTLTLQPPFLRMLTIINRSSQGKEKSTPEAPSEESTESSMEKSAVEEKPSNRRVRRPQSELESGRILTAFGNTLRWLAFHSRAVRPQV